jgi:3'-5' exoribonuclease 1
MFDFFFFRPWDLENFLNLQCLHSQIDYPYWGTKWIDVRKLFSNWFNVRRCGIKKMLNYIGLDFEGQQHCGLDDAKNISKILLRLVNDGCKLKFNEKLKSCHTTIGKNPFGVDAAADVDME